ncbi:MAG: hypothetical protein H6R00_4844 [Proteobacteria bacterium]|nr:hypothetical protein [Pseudomonadota bacterium]
MSVPSARLLVEWDDTDQDDLLSVLLLLENRVRHDSLQTWYVFLYYHFLGVINPSVVMVTLAAICDDMCINQKYIVYCIY